MEARSLSRCKLRYFNGAFAGCETQAREQRARGASFYLAVWGLLSPRNPASHHHSSLSFVERFGGEVSAHGLQCCQAVRSPECRSSNSYELSSIFTTLSAQGSHSTALESETAPADDGGEGRHTLEASGVHIPVEGEPAESLPFGFQQALQAVPSFGPVKYDGCDGAEILPIMPLGAVKFPTDDVALQLFEPRYRAMFKLVNQTPRKRFGIVLGDRLNATMESVGCVCEIRQYVPLAARRRILVDAQATGRFRVHKILLDKPFVTAVVEEVADSSPASVAEEATLATLEMRVAQCMQDVHALAVKLYGHLGSLSGNDLYNTEAWRWSAGSQQEGACTDGIQRRERFSFALARTLDDLSLEEQQQLLESQSTADRLRRIETALLEGRQYLAARSTLRDAFS